MHTSIFYSVLANNLTSSYRALSPNTRMMVGFGILAWGTIGLYMSDAAEKKLGFEPSETDKNALDRSIPKIRAIDRD